MKTFSKKLKEMNNLPKCKDCKHFKPAENDMGDCFGVEASGGMDAADYPANALEPIGLE